VSVCARQDCDCFGALGLVCPVSILSLLVLFFLWGVCATWLCVLRFLFRGLECSTLFLCEGSAQNVFADCVVLEHTLRSLINKDCYIRITRVVTNQN